MTLVSDVTSIEKSGSSRIDALLDVGPSWNYQTTTPANVLYYSFSGYVSDSSVSFASTFNLSQQAAARQMLAYVENVTGIDFVETSAINQADFLFASGDIAGANVAGLCAWEYSYSYSGGNVVTSYDARACIYLDTFDFDDNLNPASGTEGYQILLHEMGHALGLKHPFEGSPTLSAVEDNTNNTLMSYSWAGNNKTAFQAYDLDALWWIYGGDGLGGMYGINSVYGPTLPGVLPVPLPAPVVDTTAPTLLAFSPVDGAADVAVGSHLVFTFSENIARGSGSIVLQTASGQRVASYDAASSSRLSFSGNTLIIDPVNDLAASTQYRVIFAAGSVLDLAGNRYAGSSSYDFSTAAPPDVIAPVLVSTTPLDAGQDVLPDSSLVLVFNEAIARGNGTVTLKTESGALVASFDAATSSRLSFDGSSLIIDPVSDLAHDTRYVVNITSGAVTDLAGNRAAALTNYDFTTIAAADAYATAGDNTLLGTASGERMYGLDGNDLMAGKGGNDRLDGGAGRDTALFSGLLSDYSVVRYGDTVIVSNADGGDGTDTLAGFESLAFADMTVNLTIQATAAAAPVEVVQRIMELYVAFFNRVPDAYGLEYWIQEYQAGGSILGMAESFYQAGIENAAITGYSANMSNADFINTIYRNVLGRSEGADIEGLAYWNNALQSGEESRGTLVSTILVAAHEYIDDPTWGWQAQLLNNKLDVASSFALEYGLSFNTPQASIAKGMQIAAAVTPTDTQAAIVLIGVSEGQIALG